MRKSKILAAVCSFIFVMNCSACNGTEQEVLLIGQQGTVQEILGTGQQGTDQEILGTGQQGTTQEILGTGQQGADQNTLLSEQSGKESPGLSQSPAQEICVYVCGAVEIPGVVFLPDGSRVADALDAAGGFATDAAQEAVNLAAKVSDGEKLYFPTREEYVPQAQQEEAAAAGLVNINTADVSQLCTLPGIGESRAADIIAYRETHGGFAACEDIMQVSGIKESVYNKISSKITVR